MVTLLASSGNHNNNKGIEKLKFWTCSSILDRFVCHHWATNIVTLDWSSNAIVASIFKIVFFSSISSFLQQLALLNLCLQEFYWHLSVTDSFSTPKYLCIYFKLLKLWVPWQPGATPHFKWRGWSNGGKFNTPKNSQGFQQNPKESIDQATQKILAKLSYPKKSRKKKFQTQYIMSIFLL